MTTLINNKPLLTFEEFQQIAANLNATVFISMNQDELAGLFDKVFTRAKKFQQAFDDLKCPPRHFTALLSQFMMVEIAVGMEEYNKLLQASYNQIVAQLDEPELEEDTLKDFLEKRIEK